MKVSAILESIDQGSMALPEFQRGYVWNRKQVRELMHSLYREYPVGSLLAWKTSAEDIAIKGAISGATPAGHNLVDLLLDGQQRITSLYGIMRGYEPTFFQGNAKAFTGLYFDIRSETFEFYGPVKMGDDPLWVNVTEVYKTGLTPWFARLSSLELDKDTYAKYLERLNKLTAISNTEFHIDRIIGSKDLDEVVDIFNRVNSGGTKLSKGDLALARVCSRWPTARQEMLRMIGKWETVGYHFKLGWLLRCITTVATNQASFSFLDRDKISISEIESAFQRTEDIIDFLLNLVSNRLGFDHDRVLGGRYSFSVMSRFVDNLGGQITDFELQNKLLFWYIHSSLWGRYSGSTESIIKRDLDAHNTDGINGMIKELERWRGSLKIRPGDFDAATISSRMYPIIYLLSRVYAAKDLISGLELSKGMLGAKSQLELHHIFPKTRLRRAGYSHKMVNAVANFCFLTAGSNKIISAREPAEYLAEIAKDQPDALRSQWIPEDRSLWQINRYPDFLRQRRELLAEAANDFLARLRSGHSRVDSIVSQPNIFSTVTSANVVEHQEEDDLSKIIGLTNHLGLAAPQINNEFIDAQSGVVLAQADAVWPEGVQVGLTQPIAYLMEPDESIESCLNELGYRFFTKYESLIRYFEEILGIDIDQDGVIGEPVIA